MCGRVGCLSISCILAISIFKSANSWLVSVAFPLSWVLGPDRSLEAEALSEFLVVVSSWFEFLELLSFSWSSTQMASSNTLASASRDRLELPAKAL